MNSEYNTSGKQTENFDYYAFQANMVISVIKEEISFYEKNPWVKEVGPMNLYHTYLVGRITSNRPELGAYTAYDGYGASYEIKKLNPDEYNLELNVLVFRKPWAKLKEFHKIMKIKEFIEKMDYVRLDKTKKTSKQTPLKELSPEVIAANKEQILNEIILGLRSKKFNKNRNEIVYDSVQMSITSISCIERNKKGLYEIEWE
jgi:hypothetical protein